VANLKMRRHGIRRLYEVVVRRCWKRIDQKIRIEDMFRVSVVGNPGFYHNI
jgi:hypothetical protein